jgi:hypothetical protein
MQDSKDINWGSNDPSADDDTEVTTADAKRDNGNAAEADGWQQYRRWISKAPAPNRRRSGVDPSLYTWKGYRDWTEQIKRNWSENS